MRDLTLVLTLVGTLAVAAPAAAQGSAAAGKADFGPAPDWDGFMEYAYTLDRQRREGGDGGPATPDRRLEWMKAELAKGAYGLPPPRRLDFGQLQAAAEAAVAPGAPLAAAQAEGRRMEGLLQLWGPGFEHDEGGGLRALGAALAIELPPVRRSWFVDHDALAAFDETPDVLGGRFGIVHRYVVKGPPVAVAATGYDYTLYGMDHAIHLLVRPVRRVQLFADGRLDARDDFARRHVALTDDDHGCGDWAPGFASGSLTAFYVDGALPQSRAVVSERTDALDRGATGFVAATTRVFDLDHDAVPDLLVWEARGAGPGHFEPTGTDDTWYRLVLANVGGRWTVLAIDPFSYGCGC